MDSISSCLLILNIESNNESICTKDELNDSIDLYMDLQINQMEREIVKYLHGMGIQTKTDPQLKEQQYWSQRRIESNKKLEEYRICPKLLLNSSLSRLLEIRKPSAIKYFNKSESSLQTFITY